MMSKTTICPNCDDGFENNPPLRRCGVCKGKGRLPYPSPLKGVGSQNDEAQRPAEPVCYQAQGGI